MAELYFGILKAVFSAVEEKAIVSLKEASPGRYVRNGRQRNQRQIRTAYGLVKGCGKQNFLLLGLEPVMDWISPHRFKSSNPSDGDQISMGIAPSYNFGTTSKNLMVIGKMNLSS